jgi:hypothetical protein
MEPLFTELCSHGLRLAVLSNWYSRLHRVIDGHGWNRWLKGGVLISSEIGVEKPDRAMFSHAATALAAPPVNCCTWATAGNTMSPARSPLAGTPLGSAKRTRHWPTTARSGSAR